MRPALNIIRVRVCYRVATVFLNAARASASVRQIASVSSLIPLTSL
jgi:hypothetical protein